MKNILTVFAILMAGSAAHAWGQDCAVVYSDTDFRSAPLTLKSGDAFGNLAAIARDERAQLAPNWDNQITSLKVAPGCLLVAYQFRGFGIDEASHRHAGFTVSWFAEVAGPATEVSDLRRLSKKISSLRCVCDQPAATPTPTPAPSPAPTPTPSNITLPGL